MHARISYIMTSTRFAFTPHSLGNHFHFKHVYPSKNAFLLSGIVISASRVKAKATQISAKCKGCNFIKQIPYAAASSMHTCEIVPFRLNAPTRSPPILAEYEQASLALRFHANVISLDRRASSSVLSTHIPSSLTSAPTSTNRRKPMLAV